MRTASWTRGRCPKCVYPQALARPGAVCGVDVGGGWAPPLRPHVGPGLVVVHCWALESCSDAVVGCPRTEPLTLLAAGRGGGPPGPVRPRDRRVPLGWGLSVPRHPASLCLVAVGPQRKRIVLRGRDSAGLWDAWRSHTRLAGPHAAAHSAATETPDKQVGATALPSPQDRHDSSSAASSKGLRDVWGQPSPRRAAIGAPTSVAESTRQPERTT